MSTGQTLVLRPPDALTSVAGAPPFTGDLAPHRPRCDVTLEGAVHAVGKSIGVHARLAIHAAGPESGTAPLVDRRLYVAGERDASGGVSEFASMPLTFDRALGGAGHPSNPIGAASPLVLDAVRPQRPGCLAAIPPAWPVRSAQLGAGALRDEGGVLVLGDPFPWTYFQQAPFEQQVDALPPGAVVTLEHLSPIARRLSFVIPSAAPRVTVDGTPLEVRVDTMAIDTHRSVVCFVYRGARPFAGAKAEVRVVFEGALAERATAGIDRAAVAAPIAPFLLAAMRARPAEAPPPPDRAETAPVDRRALDAPIAPFLLGAKGAPRAAVDVSATPFVSPAVASPTAPVPPETPATAPASAHAPPMRPPPSDALSSAAPAPAQPAAVPGPAPTPPLRDRLRAQGMSDAQIAAIERSLTGPRRELPPSDD
ncbi:MAG: DUF2169 domain-containing protein [Polyangiaceae bacterium]